MISAFKKNIYRSDNLNNDHEFEEKMNGKDCIFYLFLLF